MTGLTIMFQIPGHQVIHAMHRCNCYMKRIRDSFGLWWSTEFIP